MKPNQTSYRDRIYDQYVDGRTKILAPESLSGLKPRSWYIKRILRKHFPADRQASILDVGCGHGAMVHFALEAGYKNVCGVDGSRQQVEAAKRLGIEAVRHGDLMTYLSELPSESHDVVVAFDVIEHFLKEEVIAFVDQVHRVLKPSGTWILHTCNGEALFGARCRYGDFTHELAFTPASLAQLLLSSRFSSVESFEDMPIVHGIKSGARWMCWKLVRSILKLVMLAETGNGDAIFSQNFLAVAKKEID